MSASRSAKNKRKLARQRKRRQHGSARRRGPQRFPRAGGGFSDAPGGVRMSDVLEEFLEPFEHLAKGEEAYSRLLTLAVLAWNAALTPEGRQQEMVDECFRKAMGGVSEEMQAVGKELVAQLIARKRRDFAEYRRPILDFKLTDLGDSYHLTVVSLVE